MRFWIQPHCFVCQVVVVLLVAPLWPFQQQQQQQQQQQAVAVVNSGGRGERRGMVASAQGFMNRNRERTRPNSSPYSQRQGQQQQQPAQQQEQEQSRFRETGRLWLVEDYPNPEETQQQHKQQHKQQQSSKTDPQKEEEHTQDNAGSFNDPASAFASSSSSSSLVTCQSSSGLLCDPDGLLQRPEDMEQVLKALHFQRRQYENLCNKGQRQEPQHENTFATTTTTTNESIEIQYAIALVNQVCEKRTRATKAIDGI